MTNKAPTHRPLFALTPEDELTPYDSTPAIEALSQAQFLKGIEDNKAHIEANDELRIGFEAKAQHIASDMLELLALGVELNLSYEGAIAHITSTIEARIAFEVSNNKTVKNNALEALHAIALQKRYTTRFTSPLNAYLSLCYLIGGASGEHQKALACIALFFGSSDANIKTVLRQASPDIDTLRKSVTLHLKDN